MKSLASSRGGGRGNVFAAFLIAWAALAVGAPVRAQDLEDPNGEPRPPPISSHYLQYGVAFAAEMVPSAGSICPGAAASVPECILGSGGGLAVRLGYRSRGPWYLGGAYEFSRQDSSNLLRLAILQQARAEARYLLSRVTRVSPFLAAGAGGLLYGNEWGMSTWGGGASLGGGLEFQVNPRLVIDWGVSYRMLWLRSWSDGVGEQRADGALGFGLAHFVGLELGVDLRQPLARW